MKCSLFPGLRRTTRPGLFHSAGRTAHGGSPKARRGAYKLRAGRVGPPDGAIGELHSHIKAAFWPGLAIHDLSGLRELPCDGSKKKALLGPPEPFGHQASAVRADVARNSPFGKTRLLNRCDLDGDSRSGTLLNSSVEEQLPATEWWSKGVHIWVKSPRREQR